jgi:thiamine transporter ThiT
MRLKDMTEVGILLAIGFVLHSVFPPILFGMKPDFSLAMLFAIILIKRDLKLAILAGLVTGVFTAMTTGFPGGQVANLVDKLLTTLIIAIPMVKVQKHNATMAGIVNAIGTVISGTIFLTVAGVVAGLPGSMMVLMLSVVLPAAIVNTLTGTILYSAILQSKRMLGHAQISPSK